MPCKGPDLRVFGDVPCPDAFSDELLKECKAEVEWLESNMLDCLVVAERRARKFFDWKFFLWECVRDAREYLEMGAPDPEDESSWKIASSLAAYLHPTRFRSPIEVDVTDVSEMAMKELMLWIP